MKSICAALLSLLSVYSFGQSPVAERLKSGYDLGLGYSTGNYNPSITYFQLLNVGGERKVFSIGWTVRLGAFYGDNLNYYTAPARLSRGKAGLGAIGAPLVVQNIDTIRYDYATMTSLNVGIRAQVNLGPVEIGGSADLLGLTLGRSRTVRYKSSTGQFIGADSTAVPFTGNNVFQKASPSLLNVRLLGDNDRGTLATEVYARARINRRLGVKVAWQLLTTEATVAKRDIVADNNRFRNRASMVYLGLTFPIVQ